MVVDAIGLRIFWDRLIYLAEQTAATLVKTAFSTSVREGHDYACVLLDRQGRALAQPWDSTPSFCGTIPLTVRKMLEKYPPEHLAPGDSLCTNDPWLSAGHLPDLTICTPIFSNGTNLLGFSAITAHMPDIGGTLNYGATRDIYEEGLQIPVLKLVKQGVVNDDLLQIIRQNVRMNEMVAGDITAMLVANDAMATGLLKLLAEEGITDFNAVADQIIDRSDSAMRAAIAEIPEGTYRGAVTFENGGLPITLVSTITIRDQAIHVDFAGSTAQVPLAFNTVMNYTYSYTTYPLKCLFGPRLPNNDGCLRRITVAAPPGSILNPLYPAPVVKRAAVGHFIHAALFTALAPVLPERVMAHSGSTPGGLENFSGRRSDGSSFVQLISGSGGAGACPSRDGDVYCFPSNLGNSPVEMIEWAVPLLIERRELIPDSGGAGRRRGALGVRLATRNISPADVSHSFVTSRLNYPAEGLLGGMSGGRNRVLLNGEPHPQPTGGRWTLRPGDVVTIEYPGGGGLGPPGERDPARVIADLRDGYVSAEAAKAIYGVDVPRAGAPDSGTKRTRQ